jgi:hypothetical protein
MKATITKAATVDVQEDQHYHPVISLLLPFEPKMTPRSKLAELLTYCCNKVENDLLEKYSGEIAMLMIDKLRTLIANLNFNTHKKSIAIFLSPIIEKIFYLDILLERKISIDDDFNIRQLVYQKKQEQDFLVMMLTKKESRLYLASSGNMVRIVTTTPRPLQLNHVSPGIADSAEYKKVAWQQFLQYADNTLGIILKAYPLPLFINGKEEVIQDFESITRFKHAIIKYVPSVTEDVTVSEIEKKIRPYAADWAAVKQQYLLNKLRQSIDSGRLITGVKEVWKEAMKRKGMTLVVEKSFCYPEQECSGEEILFNVMESHHTYSYVKSAVDDIIEKVFENGGDVEFVEDGMLGDFDRIVLVEQN